MSHSKKNHQKFAWPFNHTFFVRRAWGKLCAWLSGYKDESKTMSLSSVLKIKNKATKENISIYFDNCYSRIKNIRENAKLVFGKKYVHTYP